MAQVEVFAKLSSPDICSGNCPALDSLQIGIRPSPHEVKPALLTPFPVRDQSAFPSVPNKAQEVPVHNPFYISRLKAFGPE